MQIGVMAGILVGMLVGAGAAFATTNFIDGARFLAKDEAFQTGYVAGVSDTLWLVNDTGVTYVTSAVRCLDRHPEWKTDAALGVVKSALASRPGDTQYTMASNISEYLRQACP